MIKNRIHLQILEKINNYQSKSDQKQLDWVKKYLGSNKKFHGLNTKEMGILAKTTIKENNLNKKETVDLINSLYKNGTSYTEISLAAAILSLSPKLLAKFNPKHLDNWLNYTCGWAENDVLCQSNFTNEILLSNWQNWKIILKEFNKNSNINKRRASLVLLVKSLQQSDDPRLSVLAFQNIENLKPEKEILITKAVSWLLRALVAFHKQEVLDYLAKNKETLPKIAYREAISKAITGKKYNKIKK